MLKELKVERKTYEVLEPGAYMCRLAKIEECAVQDYHDKSVEHPGVKFVYTVDGAEDVKIYREVRQILSNTGNKSNLYRDLSAMLGGSLTDDVMKDDAKLLKAMNELVGKQFLVTIELKTSQAGNNYNKFVSVARPIAAKAERVAQQPAGQPVGDGSAFSEDDIPF